MFGVAWWAGSLVLGALYGEKQVRRAHLATVWVKRDKKRKCALHTESRKGDPFGRTDKDLLAEPSTDQAAM